MATFMLAILKQYGESRKPGEKYGLTGLVKGGGRGDTAFTEKRAAMGELADKLAGRFIVIDGPDGAGKSTQLAMLGEHLSRSACGLDVTLARDPGGTPIGDRIREILLDTKHGEMTVGCEMMLYMASRAQLMGEVIAPALRDSRCVLCDRWVSSTVAYQVAEGKATAADVMMAYRAALGDAGPDLTVILDIDSAAGLDRAGATAGGHDRMEAKGLDFHRKVRELFLAQAAEEPRRFTVVDAAGGVDEVHQRILNAIEHAAWGDG